MIFWIVIAAVAVFLGRYIWLQVRLSGSRARSRDAERRLQGLAGALHRHAMDHGGHLPDSVVNLGLEGPIQQCYRPVPRLDLDPRLILIHDPPGNHLVIEFPSLRPARGVVLCSGRYLVLTEEAFQELLRADAALRERLNLPAVSQ